MPTVDVGGTHMWYTEVGEGAPCLVIHGGLGLDHAYFRPEMDRLAASGLRLIYVDMRGHGRSGRPAPETITHEQICADLEVLRKHLGFEQWLVLGHSYGGFISLEYAVRYPGRACHLILTGTGAKMDTWDRTSAIISDRRNEHPEAVESFLKGGYHDDASFERWLQTIGPLYFHRAPAAVGADILGRITYSATSGAQMGPNLETYDVVDDLPNIRTPTLILHGRHDFVLPHPQAERLARGIPDAELVTFEESGHFPWIEEKEKFFGAFASWIARKTPVAVEA